MKNEQCDHEADDRVCDRSAGCDDGRADEDGEADEAVDSGVVPSATRAELFSQLWSRSGDAE